MHHRKKCSNWICAVLVKRVGVARVRYASEYGTRTDWKIKTHIPIIIPVPYRKVMMRKAAHILLISYRMLTTTWFPTGCLLLCLRANAQLTQFKCENDSNFSLMQQTASPPIKCVDAGRKQKTNGFVSAWNTQLKFSWNGNISEKCKCSLIGQTQHLYTFEWLWLVKSNWWAYNTLHFIACVWGVNCIYADD